MEKINIKNWYKLGESGRGGRALISVPKERRRLVFVKCRNYSNLQRRPLFTSVSATWKEKVSLLQISLSLFLLHFHSCISCLCHLSGPSVFVNGFLFGSRIFPLGKMTNVCSVERCDGNSVILRFDKWNLTLLPNLSAPPLPFNKKRFGLFAKQTFFR